MENSQIVVDYTFDQDTVSDLHKDAYGFRPRGNFWDTWYDADNNKKQSMWDEMIVALERANEEYVRREASAIVEFESLVKQTIESGAKNRETALGWLMDGTGANGDWDYFCFLYGIPYKYVKGPN